MTEVYVVRVSKFDSDGEWHWIPQAAFADYNKMLAYIEEIRPYYHLEYDTFNLDDPPQPYKLRTVAMSLDDGSYSLSEETVWGYDDEYEEPVFSYNHMYMHEHYHLIARGYASHDKLLVHAERERQRLLAKVIDIAAETQPPQDLLDSLKDQGSLKRDCTTRFYRLPSEVWYNDNPIEPVVCRVNGYKHLTAVRVSGWRVLDTKYFCRLIADGVNDVFFWGVIVSRSDIAVQNIRRLTCLSGA